MTRVERLRALLGVTRAVLGGQRRQPWQAALSLLGVALGVAVVVAIDLAADTARQAHGAAERAAAGQATQRIVGGPRGVPESVYRQLRVEMGVREAVPRLELRLPLAASAAGELRLVGIDPYVQAQRQALPDVRPGLGGSFVELTTRADALLLGAAAAERLGVAAGEWLALMTREGRRDLQVLAILAPDDALARAFVDSIAVLDIATAQELGGRQGWLDAIDLVMPDVDSARVERIAAMLPAGLLLEAIDAPLRQARQLTQAFDTNLDMLGVLALLVGLLLVYNTMSFSVLQRRAQLGVLRALGVSRQQLFVAVMIEALLVGAAASLLGLLFGQLLAEQLLGMVARTLNDLYFEVQIEALSIRAATLAKGVALGVCGALGAAAVPALEAARTAPVSAMRRSVLEQGSTAATPRLALLGVVLAAAALALLALPGEGLGVGFVALFVALLGAAATTPLLLRAAVRLLAPLADALGGPLAAHALRGIATSLSRSAVAVATLAVALATTVGVSIMVDSFRSSVDGWLRLTLRADFYVSTPGQGAAGGLPADIDARLRAVPGVAHVSLGRGAELRDRKGALQVLALRLAPASAAGFELLQGQADAVWAGFAEGGVLISEPLAHRRRLGLGDRLEVLGVDGWLRLPVVGVYRDYGSERGAVLMQMEHYQRRFADLAIGTAGVFVAAGLEPAAVATAVRAALADRPGLATTSSAELRERSLIVFDRTFAVTRVLRAVTVLVAFVGVLSALMALQMERARELALLRALGVSRAQAAGTVLLQTGTMGLCAALLALPAGVGVGVMLVQVINRRAFGWTMDLHLDAGLALQVLTLSLVAALLAGLYPALRLGLRAPAEALRHE